MPSPRRDTTWLSVSAVSFGDDDDDFFGNSFDPVTLTYLFDYHEIEAFAEMTFGFFDKPLMLFGDYVTNTDENDSGYAVGFKYGKASAGGTWDIGYVYQKLEAEGLRPVATGPELQIQIRAHCKSVLARDLLESNIQL